LVSGEAWLPEDSEMDLAAIIFVVIALIGGGIVTLRTGEIRATKNSVVDGRAARVIGWLLLLSIPLAFMSYWFLPGILAVIGNPVNSAGIAPLLAFCLPLVGCPLMAVAIGFATAKQLPREPAPGRPSPGSIGQALSPLTPCGTIEVDGDRFPARSIEGDIALGCRVVVTGFDPLWLFVREMAPTSPLQTRSSGNEGIQAI
jgi:membrane-bound ClpP family serine protease